VCWGVSAMTLNTRLTNSSGTRAWNRSLIELTNTSRGSRHRNGRLRSPSWRATPKPGPEVRGCPSVWYFADPIAFRRFASVSA
jgi:hypothetical protein